MIMAKNNTIVILDYLPPVHKESLHKTDRKASASVRMASARRMAFRLLTAYMGLDGYMAKVILSGKGLHATLSTAGLLLTEVHPAAAVTGVAWYAWAVWRMMTAMKEAGKANETRPIHSRKTSESTR